MRHKGLDVSPSQGSHDQVVMMAMRRGGGCGGDCGGTCACPILVAFLVFVLLTIYAVGGYGSGNIILAAAIYDKRIDHPHQAGSRKASVGDATKIRQLRLIDRCILYSLDSYPFYGRRAGLLGGRRRRASKSGCQPVLLSGGGSSMDPCSPDNAEAATADLFPDDIGGASMIGGADGLHHLMDDEGKEVIIGRTWGGETDRDRLLEVSRDGMAGPVSFNPSPALLESVLAERRYMIGQPSWTDTNVETRGRRS